MMKCRQICLLGKCQQVSNREQDVEEKEEEKEEVPLSSDLFSMTSTTTFLILLCMFLIELAKFASLETGLALTAAVVARRPRAKEERMLSECVG